MRVAKTNTSGLRVKRARCALCAIGVKTIERFVHGSRVSTWDDAKSHWIKTLNFRDSNERFRHLNFRDSNDCGDATARGTKA